MQSYKKKLYGCFVVWLLFNGLLIQSASAMQSDSKNSSPNTDDGPNQSKSLVQKFFYHSAWFKTLSFVFKVTVGTSLSILIFWLAKLPVWGKLYDRKTDLVILPPVSDDSSFDKFFWIQLIMVASMILVTFIFLLYFTQKKKNNQSPSKEHFGSYDPPNNFSSVSNRSNLSTMNPSGSQSMYSMANFSTSGV